jgi:hypothetical protein
MEVEGTTALTIIFASFLAFAVIVGGWVLTSHRHHPSRH